MFNRIVLFLVVGVCVAASAAAQISGFFRPSTSSATGDVSRYSTRDAAARGFTFCRGIYTSSYHEAGGSGWTTDYPDAERNLTLRLAEMTKTRVNRSHARSHDGDPTHLVVALTDPALFQCPYLHMEDVGTAAFTDAEVRGLRTYLQKGGFLWVDDFWGSLAWTNWEREIGRVLPPTTFPIRNVSVTHPIFQTMFQVKALTQIPSIQFWMSSGGETSERGTDSAEAHFRGISDPRGTLMVLMTHNTDVSDAWEREAEDPQFLTKFGPEGYAVGINVVLYAMTH